jgi:hypothetical protein
MDLIERKTLGALVIFFCGVNNDVAARLKLKLRPVSSPTVFTVVLLGRRDEGVLVFVMGSPFDDFPLTGAK